MTIQGLGYPTTKPGLVLDFAKSKRLDPRITYSRSSIGTYFEKDGSLRAASAGVARFDHDPATGESLGLLSEEARTNYVVKSTPVPADLASLRSVIFSTSTTATPANTTDAILHQCGATANTVEYFSSGFSIPSSGKIVTSVFIKNISATKVVIAGDPSNLGYYAGIASTIDFTISPPTITKLVAVGSEPLIKVGLIPLPNGWYRAYQVIDLDIPSVVPPTGSTRGSVPCFVGGVSGQQFLSWGYQIEAGSHPTSYIPTRATFISRSTAATYYDATGTIQAAGTDVARGNAYFPDADGVMRRAGLLLEAAGVNLASQSQTFSTWAPIGCTVASNGTSAPDQTATAMKLAETSSLGFHRIEFPIALTGSYTLSVFAKPDERSILTLVPASTGGGDTPVYIDLAAGIVLGSVPAGFAVSVQKFPSGWCRCSVTGTMGDFGYPFIGVAAVPGVQSYGGATGFGILIWGAQLEAGSYATSYIPTTTGTGNRAADVSSSSQATRNADVAVVQGDDFSAWYNQAEGTLLLNSTSTKSGSNSHYASLSDGTLDNRIGIWGVESNAARGISVLSGVSIEISSAALTASRFKAALGLKQGSYGFVHDNDPGVSVTTSNQALPAATRLGLGTPFGSGSPNFSFVTSRLAYWPERLPDVALRAITR